jgi:hypothetical protein
MLRYKNQKYSPQILWHRGHMPSNLPDLKRLYTVHREIVDQNYGQFLITDVFFVFEL